MIKFNIEQNLAIVVYDENDTETIILASIAVSLKRLADFAEWIKADVVKQKITRD